MEDCLSWDDVSLFMNEVKTMAHRLLRLEHQASLQTTGLVLSALERMRGAEQEWQQVTWATRQAFFSAMYRAMTRALVDHARSRARRREIPVHPEDLHFDNLPQMMAHEPALVVALVEALHELKALQPQWAEAIEHRFFGGLTLDEAAQLMEVDERTIRRWWERARLLLSQRIVQLMHADIPAEFPS